MLLELPEEWHRGSKCLVRSRLFLRVLRVSCRGGMLIMRSRRAVSFVELLGSFRTFEIMTLAGHSTGGNSQQQDREKFHRAAS